MNTPRLLVIDDERSIRELLEFSLGSHGFAVHLCVDGPTALDHLRAHPVDGIVCDVMLPKIDGVTLIASLRRLTQAPILMLSAKGAVEDRIAGLRNGADDYMGKPFAMEELVVRLHALLRRPLLREPKILRYADLEVDLETRRVRRDDRDVALSAREYDLLLALLRSPRQVFTRDQLLENIWGTEKDVGPGTVETYISYLRAKIDAEFSPRLIHTVRGVGYTLK